MSETKKMAPRKRAVKPAEESPSVDPTELVTPQNSDSDWKQKIAAEKAAKQGESKPEKVENAPTEGTTTEPQDSAILVDESSETESEEKPLTPAEFKRKFNGLIALLNGTPDEVRKIIEEEQNRPDSDMVVNGKLNMNAYGNKLLHALTFGMLTQMQEFNAHLIEGIDDRLTKLTLDIGKTSHGRTDIPPGTCPVLKGNDARINAIARLRGLKKIYLYNSGFWITIRPMSLLELNEFVNTVDEERNDLGRTLGGHLYSVVDLFCRKKIMELLPRIVVSSNLIGYNVGTTLQDCLSLHDFETVLWAICTLLYRDGIEVDLMCVNPECRHVDPKQLIDINKMRYNNLTIIPQPLLEQITKGDNITQEQALEYQRKLAAPLCRFETEDCRFIFQAPTMTRFLDIADLIMAKIVAAVHGERTLDNAQVTDSISLTSIRMMSPWVNVVYFKNRETGEDEFAVNEAEPIMSVLEDMMDAAEDVYERIDAFIQKTRVSHIAYTGLECPVCHKKPNGDLNDFFPFDVQYLFFFLAWRLLSLSGKQ